MVTEILIISELHDHSWDWSWETAGKNAPDASIGADSREEVGNMKVGTMQPAEGRWH